MTKVYVYVVARDFGFAPNPFHGVCTLATCKPKIRGVAKIGDWVVGMGGGELGATGKCIYFMQVTGAMSFNEYWAHPDFISKRPARNGSRTTMLGDNIYHREHDEDQWTQENSHHSLADGTPEWWNVENDTSRDRILVSTRFVYFGKDAPNVPKEVLDAIGYENVRNHRTFHDWECQPLLDWVEKVGRGKWNMVLADPFQFHDSGARYSKEMDRVVKAAAA
jgi:hypothetical protein